MSGNTGIVPTLPMNDGGFGNSGEWIFGLIFLAAMFNGGFGGRNNDVATAGQVASQAIQDNMFTMSSNMNNGFNAINGNVSNGFARTNDNICDARQAIYNTSSATNAQLAQNAYNLNTTMLENRYANQLAQNETQKDILSQTSQLGSQASINALENQSKMDSCCCEIKTAVNSGVQRVLDQINSNTIDSLREQLNDYKNTITAMNTTQNVISQVRPFPMPAYLTSSPYQSVYNPYYNGIYGNVI